MSDDESITPKGIDEPVGHAFKPFQDRLKVGRQLMRGVSRQALLASFAGGCVAGTLDIAYAIGVYGMLGVSPVRILQSIASGLLGANAYTGGSASAVLGGALHYAIATAMAAGYFALSRRSTYLRTEPLDGGFIYGIGLFLLMYLVVVPLSASTIGMPSGWLLAGALFAHTVLVGMPIAVVVRRLTD